MSNVVPFPTAKARHNSKVSVLETKMSNLQKMLEARYEHLSDLADEIGKIEDECEKFEKQYEILLKAYAERVGPENVDITFYDYSSEVAFDFVMDDGVITFELQDEEDHPQVEIQKKADEIPKYKLVEDTDPEIA